MCQGLTSGVLLQHSSTMKITPSMMPRPMMMNGMLITTLASATTTPSFLAESASMSTLWNETRGVGGDKAYKRWVVGHGCGHKRQKLPSEKTQSFPVKVYHLSRHPLWVVWPWGNQTSTKTIYPTLSSLVWDKCLIPVTFPISHTIQRESRKEVEAWRTAAWFGMESTREFRHTSKNKRLRLSTDKRK